MAARLSRGAGIRTRDLLLPKQARYRTAPRPVGDGQDNNIRECGASRGTRTLSIHPSLPRATEDSTISTIMRATGKLAPTELEGCVLGIVHTRGRCTAYVVRKELGTSPSAYWSGSAGAVYPLLDRLAQRGLLDTHETEWGSRTRRAFSLSPRGLVALRAWIGPALPSWAGSATFDPIRTRLLFLDALPRSRWPRFIRAAQHQVARALKEMRRLLAAADALSDLERWAIRGGIAELEARLRWLGQVDDELTGRATGARDLSRGGT